MRARTCAVLICPQFFDYQSLIKEQLRERYDSVYVYSDRPGCSSIAKALIKFNVFGYANKMAEQYSKTLFKLLRDKLNDISDIVIIKGTCISPSFISSVKQVDPLVRVVCYNWDSVANVNTFSELANRADRALSFDLSDCQRYGYEYLPLFHSVADDDEILASGPDVQQPNYLYSFIGSYHGDRAAVLRHFVAKNKCKDSDIFIRLYFQSRLQFLFYYLLDSALRGLPRAWITFTPISRTELDRIARASRYVIDIQHHGQTGLTMRTWETLGKGYRLLTTNPTVLLHVDAADVIVIDRSTGDAWSASQCADYRAKFADHALSFDNVDGLSLRQWLIKLLSKGDE